jgi:hypothetical protein
MTKTIIDNSIMIKWIIDNLIKVQNDHRQFDQSLDDHIDMDHDPDDQGPNDQGPDDLGPVLDQGARVRPAPGTAEYAPAVPVTDHERTKDHGRQADRR